ncbi:MAG: hypothetical protein CME71_08230 [Halobacteriovorax sp.]|nr:hypothetical protein [Halobacteriovorax sp.]|tara:strand:- start:629 stop:913 length:285 start_codon:yes stop_codon:yes gene_type:complete
MKKILTVTIAMLVLSSSAFALNPVSETADAVSAALTEYQASYGADAQVQFKGVRAAAASANGAKVKIYLNNTEDTIDYGCHRHDASDPFECHEL